MSQSKMAGMRPSLKITDDRFASFSSPGAESGLVWAVCQHSDNFDECVRSGHWITGAVRSCLLKIAPLL